MQFEVCTVRFEVCAMQFITCKKQQQQLKMQFSPPGTQTHRHGNTLPPSCTVSTSPRGEVVIANTQPICAHTQAHTHTHTLTNAYWQLTTVLEAPLHVGVNCCHHFGGTSVPAQMPHKGTRDGEGMLQSVLSSSHARTDYMT